MSGAHALPETPDEAGQALTPAKLRSQAEAGPVTAVAESAAALEHHDGFTDSATDKPPTADPDRAPEEKAEPPQDERIDNLRASFRLIRQHIRPLRVPMVIGLVLLILAALIGLGQPLATRYVLDTIASQTGLRAAVLILVAFVLAAALTQGFGQYLMLRSAEGVVLSSRRRLVDQMLGLSVSGMRKQDPGDLMARVTSDTGLIRQIALQSLAQAVTGTVVIVGSIVVMLILDALLFAVTAGVVAIVGLVLVLLMPRIRDSSRRTQKNVGEMGNELERVLGAYVTVKAAGAEEVESKNLSNKVQKAHDSGVRTAMWNSLAAMTSTLAVQAAFLVVLGVGGWRVQSGAMSVTTLIAFLLYAMQLSAPVLQLTQAMSAFQAGRAALERIAEVDQVEQEADPGTAEEPDEVENVPGAVAALGAVTWSPAAVLDRVTFSYPDQLEPAVRDVEITLPEHGFTAVVGPSGSGKSSILKLIDGFYPLDDGRLTVGGRQLAEWDLQQLRTHVAYVEQETPVLAGTLRENLTYGQEDVDNKRLYEVLQKTGLEHRVSSEADLDEQVGHRGSALSGGERQRISIARAMLREPKILLLDEATSQLDAANEGLIKKTIVELAQNCSVVLVAHRLSTVVEADQIVVMEDGKVRSVGTHSQLLERDDLYRGLVQEQRGTFAGSDAADEDVAAGP